MKDIIEEWRAIKGYEDLYQVSNLGNIRNTNGYIRKLHKDGTRGYLKIILSKKSVCKSFYVHRLVAEAFIENPKNLPCINHIDECKTNNFVNNLEWCSYKYNNNYGTMQDRGHEKLNKKVLMFDYSGKVLNEFKSISEALRQTGIKHISDCCHGRRLSAGGYLWKFK